MNEALHLLGEAWLTLPTWQLAATSSVSTAHPAALAPIRLILDDRTGPSDDGDDDDGDGDRDGGNFVEREDQVPSEYSHDEFGQFIMPSTTPPSRQERARKAVQEALTNLAVQQTIRSP